MSGERILIVEDHAANMMLVTIVLTARGYIVRTAVDAESAMAEIEREMPDLVLMDIQLPGIDGYELTRRLKADARFQRMAIVALTAYAMKGDERKAYEAGCDGYLTKPLDTRALPQQVADYLAQASAKT